MGGKGGGGGEKGRESEGEREKTFRGLAPWRFSFSALYLGALSWRPFVAPFLLAFSSRPIFAPFRPRSAESPEMILAPQLGAPRPTHGFAAVRRLRLLSRAVSAFSCWQDPPSHLIRGPDSKACASAPLRGPVSSETRIARQQISAKYCNSRRRSGPAARRLGGESCLSAGRPGRRTPPPAPPRWP